MWGFHCSTCFLAESPLPGCYSVSPTARIPRRTLWHNLYSSVLWTVVMVYQEFIERGASDSIKYCRCFSPVQSLSRIWLCDSMVCSMPGFPVLHNLPEFAQTQVHWVSDAIQLSHPLSSPSPPAIHLSQHQGLFQGVSSSHQLAKGLEFQLQRQSFQWIFRTYFL